MPRRTTALAITLACTALAACSGAEAGSGLEDSGPVAYVDEKTNEGMDALLEGTLRVTELCVLIEDPGGDLWLPIFQRPRTSWDGTTLTYNGTRHADGSHVRFGGGGLENVTEIDYLPAGCEYDLAFLVAP